MAKRTQFQSLLACGELFNRLLWASQPQKTVAIGCSPALVSFAYQARYHHRQTSRRARSGREPRSINAIAAPGIIAGFRPIAKPGGHLRFTSVNYCAIVIAIEMVGTTIINHPIEMPGIATAQFTTPATLMTSIIRSCSSLRWAS